MSTASNASSDGSSNDSGGAPAETRKHTAGAYDVRTVIAGLIGLYGIVLTIMAWSRTTPTTGPRPATGTPTCGPGS